MNKSEQEIIEGIRKIKLGKNIQLISFIAFIPVGIISALVEKTYGISFMFVLVPYALIALLLSSIISLRANCPNCGELYFWKMSGIGFRNPFTKKCLNCGLNLTLKKEKSTTN